MSTKKPILIVLTAFVILLGTTSGISLDERLVLDAPADNIPWMGPEIKVTEENMAFDPAVAHNWKQNEYLVVWSWPDGIYGQRVNTFGELVGPARFPIATGSKTRASPTVEYDPINNRYLVVWSHDVSGTNTNYDLSGRFIPWDGVSPDYKEFKINARQTDQVQPKLAYNTAEKQFLVIWWDWNFPVAQKIFGVRIQASDGSIIGSAKQLFTGAEFHWSADVAFNSKSGEYMVVWDKYIPATNLDISGMRLRGNDISPLGAEIHVASWPQREVITTVAACRDANQYLVLWGSEPTSNNTDLYGRIVFADGSLSPNVYQLQGTSLYEGDPDAACNTSGKHFLAVWQKEYNDNPQANGIWGSLVTPEGGSSAPEKVNGADPPFEIIAPSANNPDHRSPAVAGGDDQYLVVWEAYSGSGGISIHARLVYFFNEPPGKIYIYKHTQPRYTGGSFNMGLSGGPLSDFIIRDFYLKDDNVPYNSGPIKAGDYTATEVLYDKWDFVSATCDDGSPIHAINLNPAEVVTCTFVNKYPVKWQYLPCIFRPSKTKIIQPEVVRIDLRKTPRDLKIPRICHLNKTAPLHMFWSSGASMDYVSFNWLSSIFEL